jgi:hypothetical protein
MCACPWTIHSSNAIRSRFNVLCTRTCFRLYRGRLVPFSCFTLPDSFSAVLRSSGPVFMFCAPRLAFCGTVGVGFRFHVLRSRTRFRRYCGRRLRFSCFAVMNSFSTVPTASSPVFMFCVPQHVFNGVKGVGSRFHFLRPRLVFGGSEGVGSRYHVLHARTHFWRYRGRRLLFSCFTLPDSFSAVSRASSPLCMFCAPGVVSCFHVLPSRTRFGGYGGRWDPFSCFALLDSFSAVPRAAGLVFMFCALGLGFGGTVGVGSHFHVLCA